MTVFKPMLAGKAVFSKIKYPVLASPKLDGIRCLIRNGVAVSRSLKPVRNKTVQAWVQDHRDRLEGLDGELISGPHDAQVYNRTSSVVMSAEGGDNWEYHVFDDWRLACLGHVQYIDRLSELRGWAEGYGQVRKCKLVDSVWIEDEAQLLEFEAKCLGQGYEGIMLRDPDGPYKYGRSTTNEGYLLKLKRFEDDEAVVIGVEERMHNKNEATKDALGHTERSTAKEGLVPAGDLGALICRRADGVVFKIGSGFTPQQRIDLWRMHSQDLLGRIAKYKHFAFGSKERPRFPIFLCFRDPDDM